MALTPWGDSDSLRDRRLRPGPGTPRDEVVANQRQRFFGAMVASVAERGYRATTVADLVEIAGVSSRTFYDLFPDKQACFLATLEAIIEAAIAYAAQRAGEFVADPAPGGVTLPDDGAGDGSWEQQAGQGMRAFAEMIVAQPAAARLALVEAYTAGPEALVPLEQAMAGFEWLTRQVLERSPERAEMPAEMVIGADRGPSRRSPAIACAKGRERGAAGADRRALGPAALLPAAARAAAPGGAAAEGETGRRPSPTTTPSGRCGRWPRSSPRRATRVRPSTRY